MFLRQLAWEQLLFWRSREAAIFVFLLPVLLFVLLASVYSGDIKGHPATSYLLVGMLGYGVANTAFGGLTIFLVIRRESGILKRLRSTPLQPPAYLAAVLTSSLLAYAAQAALLVALALAAYDAELPDRPLSLLATLALGALSFAGLGLGVTSLVRSSEGSSPIVNVVIIPMAFLSGSFGPRGDYPTVLRVIGDVLPLSYFIDLVEGAYLNGEVLWEHPLALAVLAAWGVGGAAVAARGFGWMPRER